MSTEVETSLEASPEAGTLGEAILKRFLGCARNDKKGGFAAAGCWLVAFARGCGLALCHVDRSGDISLKRRQKRRAGRSDLEEIPRLRSE
jgi:hypothetical protein